MLEAVLEARFEDPINGPSLIAFDGRVLELFTFRSAEAQRLHRTMMYVELKEPDKRGTREVWFTGGPNRKGGGFRLAVTPDYWAQIEPIVAAAQAASEQ